MSEHVRIVIIGAGFSGIGAAVKLLERGTREFVVLERSDEVGGVWRDNRYPGCGCDIESPLYSFSFAPNPAWSRMYSPQPEILAYLRRCADEFGVRPFVRFGWTVEEVSYDEQTRRWTIIGPRGRITADVVIAAVGALTEPSIPSVRGAERFAGAMFHSARWDDSVALAGKRVAVIGTGASAIQIIPELQREVAELRVFQRTPPWVIPRRDREFGALEQQLFAALPITQKLLRARLYLRHEAFLIGFRNPAIMRVIERVASRYLAVQVRDPKLRAQLRPNFAFGCKRVLLSDNYYPALVQANVEVVSAGLRELVPAGIVDSEGRLHELDVIVWATGFHVTDSPYAQHIFGRGGQSLAEVWRGSPKALLGTMVAGFPNLFLMTGPNTGLGHNSMIVMIEAQLRLIMGALRELEAGAHTLEPDPAAQARFSAALDRGGQATVWTAGGCSSWYLDETGRNSTLWPWSTYRFMRAAKFDRADYVIS
jgi:cation diffusion facilitator CzcD-associated flavoprotein CzcO